MSSPKKRKRKKKYFDPVEYNLILTEVQDLYRKKKDWGLLPMEEKRLKYLMNDKVMSMVIDVANKIYKHRRYFNDKDDFEDGVQEACKAILMSLMKGGFDSNRGSSFSYITSVVENVGRWTYYKIHRDLPFTYFQEKSHQVHQTMEGLIFYLSQYSQEDSVPVEDSREYQRNTEKLGQWQTGGEEIVLSELMSKDLIDFISQEASYYAKEKRFIELLILDSFFKYLENELSIDKISNRKFKKFALDRIQEVGKDLPYKGTRIKDMKRGKLLSIINRFLYSEFKDRLRKMGIGDFYGKSG